MEPRPGAATPESRGYAAMRAYVTGETSLSLIWSGLRGIPDEVTRRVLARSRPEFEKLNAARAVLLESIVGGKGP